MAYRLPTWIITCDISQPPAAGIVGIPPGPYRITGQICQLTYGHRVNVVSTGGTVQVGVLALCMNLLLPPRTDIRGPQDTTSFDMVQVPSGSGRWYSVAAVDDIGKGFTNEHRSASIYAVSGSWVPPYP